jgi:hypothetical protein
MKEVYDLLKDAAGFTQQETDERFKITEQNGEWVLKAYRYLDGPTFGKILRAILDKGGKYRKDETTKFAIFTLPKQAGPKGFEPLPSQQITTSIPEEGEYALSKSLKGKLGQLVPCLTDAEGMVIDGFHRLKINPKAWTVKNDQIKTPVDRALARMTVNFCRRHYTSEEMKNDIGLLIGSGYSVQQISEVTGISDRTIYRYMPENLKKPEAKAISEGMKEKAQLTAVSSSLKTQETVKPTPTMLQMTQKYLAEEVINCEQCGQPIHRTRAVLKDSKLVCPKCAGVTKPLTPRKLEEEPTFKPKEKPEFRRAVMQPQKSKPEMDLLTELSNRGITPETDKWICLWGTNPDGQYAEKKIVYYVHGEPHDKGKALNRDDKIKAALEKEGWTVFVFRHDEGTVKEWADKIEEALK